MEVIGGVVTITGLIGGVTKIANSINNVKERWQYADLNITMVSSSLLTVKAALEEIAEWRTLSKDKSQKSEQLDTNLEVCIESCAVMVAMVENRLKDYDLENITKYDRARFVMLDQLFKDFSNNLGAQVRALQLLLMIYQCRSLSEQNEQLQRTRTKEVVRAVRQSTASLAYEDKDIEDAASILSETPTTNFEFDRIVMQHPSYSRTYPKLFRHMQQTFPSRSASVASTVKRSPATRNRSVRNNRPIPVDDPIITQNISLPFLGVPFVGETGLGEAEGQTPEDLLPPTAHSVASSIVEEEISEATPTQPVSSSGFEATSVAETPLPSAASAKHLGQATGTAQTTTAASKQVKPISSNRTSEFASSGSDMLLAQKQRQRNRASFDSFYDVSSDDDDLPISSPMPTNEHVGKTKDIVQIAADEPRAGNLEQQPQTKDNVIYGAMTDEASTHGNVSIKDRPEIPQGTMAVAADEIVASAPYAAKNNLPKGSDDATFTGTEELQEDAESPSTIHADKNETLKTGRKARSIPNILDFEFDPVPDINLKVSLFEAKDGVIEQTAQHPISMSNSPISETGPTKDLDLESPDEVMDLSTARSDEMFTAAIPDSQREIELQQESTATKFITPQTPSLDIKKSLGEINDESNPSDTPEMNYPPSPAQPPPILPPQSYRTSFIQPRTSISERSPRETTEDPAPNITLSSYQTIPNYENRNSIQSEGSNNVYAPASPTSFHSQNVASSITSTSSSYLTHDQSTYHTTGTTIMTLPPVSVSEINKESTPIDKQRTALMSSLASHAQRVGSSTHRLSGLSSLLKLKSSEKNARLKELSTAVQSDDAVKVKSLTQSFEKFTDVSLLCSIGPETQQKTALMRAASLNHLDCAAVLLGYDPSGVACIDKGGKTALHHALESKSYETALWLTDQLCKVNGGRLQYKGKDGQKVYDIADQQGICPIHLAAQAPNHSVLEILDKANADFTITDISGKNALHYAAGGKSLDNIRYIVRHGLADVNKKSAKGETPLMSAAGSGDIHSSAFLLEHGAQRDATDEDGNRAIHYAARNGHIEIMEALFQSIDDVTAKNFTGEQPLHLAAAGNHTEVLIALLHIPGVQVNSWTEPPHLKQIPDRSGGLEATAKMACTPLHYACASGQHEAADILITRGAIVNANQEDGYSPLMMATQAQNSAIVSLLLLQGADPKGATAKEGMTALHIACRVDDLACAKMLIEHGANTLARLNNRTKDTASSLALRLNPATSQNAATYAMRYRAQVLRATGASVMHGGYAPNVRNVNGWQPTMGSVPSQYPPAGVALPWQSYYPVNNEPPPPYQR